MSFVLAARVSLAWLDAMLRAVSLAPQLRGPGPFMLLAPTNEAVERLGKPLPEWLSKNMSDVLRYHVVIGSSIAELRSESLKDNKQYGTMALADIVPHIRTATLLDREPPFAINQAIKKKLS